MANLIEITVKVNGDTALAEMKTIEDTAKASAGRQKSTWDKLTTGINDTFDKMANSAVVKWGMIGSAVDTLGGPIAGLGLAVGAFAAVAMPELDKVKNALTKTGTAGKKAWAQLTPGEKTLGRDFKSLDASFHGVERSLQPLIDKVATLGVRLGKDLMPSLRVLARAGGHILEDFLKPLDKMARSASFKQIISELAKMGEQAGKILGPALAQSIENIMKSLTTNSGLAIDFLKIFAKVLEWATAHIGLILSLSFAIKAASLATKAWAAIMAILDVEMDANPIGAIILAIAALIIIIYELIKHWKTVEKVFKAVWHAIAHYFDEARHAIAHTIDDIKHDIMRWLDDIRHDVASAFDWIRGHIHAAWSSIVNDISGFIDHIVHLVASGFDTVRHWIASKFDEIRHDVAAFTDDVVRFFASLPGRIVGALGSIGSDILHSITSGLPGKVLSMIGLAHGGVVGAALGGVHGGLRMVGENGPELVRLPAGSHVYSNPDTQRMMGQGGSGKARLVIEMRGGGDAFSRFMLQWLRDHSRIEGGGDVQVAFGWSS